MKLFYAARLICCAFFALKFNFLRAQVEFPNLLSSNSTCSLTPYLKLKDFAVKQIMKKINCCKNVSKISLVMENINAILKTD